MHTKFIELFSLFNMIQPLIFMKQRMLKDEEITLVKDACYKFSALFPLYFPEKNITRNIHEFVFSVPRFINIFKTTALLSEEEGESLHAAVNMELRQLIAVRNPAEKMQLLLKRQELRSKASKNLIRREPRMCKDCKASKGKKSLLTSRGRWTVALS